jgi:hypothetical protein
MKTKKRKAKTSKPKPSPAIREVLRKLKGKSIDQDVQSELLDWISLIDPASKGIEHGESEEFDIMQYCLDELRCFIRCLPSTHECEDGMITFRKGGQGTGKPLTIGGFGHDTEPALKKHLLS